MRAGVRLIVATVALLGVTDLPAGPATPPEHAATGTVQVAFPPWDDAEALVIAAIVDAREQILVQAFSFTSAAIARALIAAKRRGVDVRMTVDREQTFGGEFTRVPELAAAGIPIWLEVRYVAAHSKVMIIDSGSDAPVLITGSYNWTWSAQHRNAENLLIVRGDTKLTRAYRKNWELRRRDALPYAQDRR
jgi:phosphatidylserine/phosphatidylglycerophosphate/cardiolipin synthase-like enzyme